MPRIILHPKSFIAFIEYREAETALYVTFRKGAQYVYQNINKRQYEAIMMANNKANYIAREIVAKRKGQLVGIVPAADMEQIIYPETKYYKTFLAR